MNFLKESKEHLKECESQILRAKQVLLSNIDKNLAIDLLNNSLIFLTLAETFLESMEQKEQKSAIESIAEVKLKKNNDKIGA